MLNRDDFEKWLSANEAKLRDRAAKWLPQELTGTGIKKLTEEMVADCLAAISEAIAGDSKPESTKPASTTGLYSLVKDTEDDPDVEEEKPPRFDGDKLLDRLLYEGVLPRYAFPTDVATFHIFDREKSTKFRHKDAYSPSQGLPVALSQYAPGKQVWVGGKCYVSGGYLFPFDRGETCRLGQSGAVLRMLGVPLCRNPQERRESKRPEQLPGVWKR